MEKTKLRSNAANFLEIKVKQVSHLGDIVQLSQNSTNHAFLCFNNALFQTLFQAFFQQASTLRLSIHAVQLSVVIRHDKVPTKRHEN